MPEIINSRRNLVGTISIHIQANTSADSKQAGKKQARMQTRDYTSRSRYACSMRERKLQIYKQNNKKKQKTKNIKKKKEREKTQSASRQTSRTHERGREASG